MAIVQASRENAKDAIKQVCIAMNLAEESMENMGKTSVSYAYDMLGAKANDCGCSSTYRRPASISAI